MLHLIRLLFAMSRTIFALFSPVPGAKASLETLHLTETPRKVLPRYTEVELLWRPQWQKSES